jgi:phosphoribosyl 1,2-cyclic phosphodiesterase
MRFTVLASGSGGNACYVETPAARVLIDAGLSCQEVMRRLESVGVDPESLDCLIITHEHTDHVRGAGALARRLDLPVYINASTLRRSMGVLRSVSRPVTIHTGQSITIHDLWVETFTKCHDAADPMGLVLSSASARLGLMTDLGRSTGVVEERLKGCHALIIESNHDVKMLEEGPYPLELKRRIKGSEGHLSNGQAAALLADVCHDGLDYVVLAHLSAINNTCEKAMNAVTHALSNRGFHRTKVLISHQDFPSPMIQL